MTKYHEKMFRIMNQFRKLNISDMLPGNQPNGVSYDAACNESRR